MEFFLELLNNGALGISIVACFLAQFIKIFTGKTKRIELTRVLTSGGMPSSHSSFVTSLATVVGLEKGFNSTDFAITAVLALIIMYDAAGVRRAVGKQAIILNQIVDDIQHNKPIEQNKLKELIGHTPMEVWFGGLLGVLTALVLI
ncbi:divergent PAP2 family protein [Clostridioides mangenotii]|uniref:divergent PAP2 family protein n=1 Tax=Metaclostridioides mangenotii TaxID=1540 RepID=UPI001C103FA5|nr:MULTISPECIES: divergent PAP2 family protein [Clostridioides]MBS5786446.1 divergent PAP2 family protein [Clostridioides difficile]MBU5306626.1 divergent PAP2 family protein [Clostridioides mangenotii]MCR1953499.1 divergent PAP2 family protein [Clostridioides mangenotii]